MKTQKWVNLGILLIAVLAFLFFSQLFESLWGIARLPLIGGDWPVEGYQVVAFALTVILALGVRSYKKANIFFNESALELSKVTFPERKETTTSATVVVFIVAIATAVLFVMDYIWRLAMQKALSL